MMNDGDEAATEADPDEGVEDVALGAEESEGPAPGEEGPDLVELEHQVGELEEGLERNASRIESVQHSQEEVAERVEEMNEIVRDLLGVYDRLTSDVNPFEEEEGAGSADVGPFGVVNGTGHGTEDRASGSAGRPDAAGAGANDDSTPGAEPAATPGAEAAAAGTDAGVTGSKEDVITFEDVVAGLDESPAPDPSASEPATPEPAARDLSASEPTAPEPSASEPTAPEPSAPEPEPTPEAPEGHRTPTAVEPEAAPASGGATPSGAAEAGPTANGHRDRGAPDRTASDRTAPDRRESDRTVPDQAAAERTPYLAELPDNYAADALVFRWLGELVETAGPSATLKAISYYEDVDWIGPSAAAALEEYLGGPGIDVYVDPNEPDDLTAEDHATSYEYILKLDAIRELEITG